MNSNKRVFKYLFPDRTMRLFIAGVLLATLTLVAIAFSQFVPTGKSYVEGNRGGGPSLSSTLPIGDSAPIGAVPESTTSKIFAGSLRVAQKSSDGISYIHSDMVGSVAAETRQAGQTGKTEYLPFGHAIASDTATRYGFGGKERDETGMHYFSARYYHAGLGRFASRDPDLSGAGSLYAFVNDNPLVLTDPTGARIELTGPSEDRLRIAEDLSRIAGIPVGWEEIDGRFFAWLSEGGHSDRPQGLRLVSDVIASRHTVRVGLGDDSIPFVFSERSLMSPVPELGEATIPAVEIFMPAFDLRLIWGRRGPTLQTMMTGSGVSEIRYTHEGNTVDKTHVAIYFYPDYDEPAHHAPGYIALGHELGHAWGYFRPHPLFGEPASWAYERMPQLPSALDWAFGMGLHWDNRVRAEENAAAGQEVYPRRGRY